MEILDQVGFPSLSSIKIQLILIFGGWGNGLRDLCCLLTSSAVTDRLRPLGGNMVWLILVVSSLTGRLYSQPPMAGPPVQANFLSCNAFDSSPLRQSLELTFKNQTCLSQYSASGFSFSRSESKSPNDWYSRFGGRLSGVAKPGRNLLSSSTLRSPELGVSARNQDQDNLHENKTKEERTSPSATTDSPGHIFWVIPAFKVDYQKRFKPLTPKEKFEEWARGSYDPLGLGAGAIEAATLEYSSKDGFCGYGGGWGGYGKCFGSLELDANVSSFIGDYALVVLLHQDPRYFRLGEGSVGRRLWYAVSRVFVTYSDSGHTVLYSSALMGTVAAAGISNLYYPQQDRGIGHSLSRIGLDLGNTALYNAAAEFWPDIHNKLHRRNQKPGDQSTGTSEKEPAPNR